MTDYTDLIARANKVVYRGGGSWYLVHDMREALEAQAARITELEGCTGRCPCPLCPDPNHGDIRGGS